MMRIFLTIALAFISTVGYANGRMRPEVIIDGYHTAAWQMACEATHFDCTLVDEPMVGYGLLPKGVLGLYFHGSRIVMVDLHYLMDPKSTAIALHEMVHYIQNARGAFDIFSENFMGRCEAEKEAFELTYAMNEKYKLVIGDRSIRRWADAYDSYPGCEA